MKKNLSLKLFFLLFVGLLLANFMFCEGIKYLNPDLKLKDVNPTNPKSGEIIKVSFILYNNGNKEGKFNIKFLNNSVFKFIGFDRDNFLVNPYSFIEFNAYFRVNDVKSGTYPLIAKVSFGNVSKYFTFYIKVINNPIIKVLQNTETCVLNRECNFSFIIKNIGFGEAKNLVLTFNLPSNSVIIDRVKGNSFILENTSLFIPQNLKEGVFNLKIYLNYLDENNNLVNKEINIPIEIKSNVNLQISSLEYNKEGYIKIKVENSGYGEARSIKAIVQLDKISRTYFLGSLDDGEDTTIYFYLPKNVYGEKNIKIKLYWEDYKNKEKDFEGKIFISKPEKDNKTIFIIFALIIIVLIFYLLMKYKKSEKNEN